MAEQPLNKNLHYLMKLYGGLSVSELARKAEIPQPTVHHILSGATKNPRRHCLESLANFFSITVSQLVGDTPLKVALPNNIKNNLQITTIPIIEWSKISAWLENKSKTNYLDEIVLDHHANPSAFALIVNDSTLHPMFPEKSVLIFDPDKAPKDRDFTLVYLLQEDSIIFNRLFIDGSECFIKRDKEDGNAQLIKLKLGLDKFIATLIEVRLKF